MLNPYLNNIGQVAFSASLAGASGGAGIDDAGLFRGGSAGLIQIVRAGAPAPDGNGTFQTNFPVSP